MKWESIWYKDPLSWTVSKHMLTLSADRRQIFFPATMTKRVLFSLL